MFKKNKNKKLLNTFYLNCSDFSFSIFSIFSSIFKIKKCNKFLSQKLIIIKNKIKDWIKLEVPNKEREEKLRM